jgi:ABC-type transport system involved in multi-copper enzyme maturation permease subunit
MFRQIRTVANFTLLEALRNRLIWLFAVVALIGVALSGFLQEIAITESRQIQAALLAAFLRFSAVFLIATFVVTSMVREFNDKGLELVLALDLSRSAYLLGKLAGFFGLALMPAVLFSLLLGLLSPLEQTALWAMSLVFELWIVVAFSLLCVLTFTQNMAALSATVAFYLMARSIDAIQLIGRSKARFDESGSQQFLASIIDMLSTLLPHLDRFSRTEWLVYQSGQLDMLLPLAGQTAIYVALLTAAALFDLYRKNL